MSNVLVIDDEPAICWSLQEVLADAGHLVEAAGSVEQAWEKMRTHAPDLVVLDVRLPGEDGLSALTEIKRRHPRAPVIVITAFGDLPTAVAALGRGAFEYLVKPFDLAQFALTVERALAPPSESAPSEGAASKRQAFVGKSAAMQAVFRQIALVAPTDYPALLFGETGTGKEVAARAIHEHSSRAAGPFVPVCPAALNPQLIESELFGHTSGAFTGASGQRAGLFELAEGGTLFLDEIADTPLSVQVKLLRVLETGRYCRVGSGEERSSSVRLIAATHRHLPKMIAEQTFREDLYHRLKVFAISLPPLRERREDIGPLVEYFLSQLDPPMRPAGVSREFWAALESRRWPGNVRELRHAVDHAAVLARGGALRPEHLPPEESIGGDAGEPGSPENQLAAAAIRWAQSQLQEANGEEGNLHQRFLQVVEPALIREVLAQAQNNRTAAARILGLDRATLRARLREQERDDEPGR
jgi:two-component system nitrogen regulation response regulator GlnG